MTALPHKPRPTDKRLHDCHKIPSLLPLFILSHIPCTMSLSIDLTTHGKQLEQVYDQIISGSLDTSWAVFSYDKGASNELKVQSTGGRSLFKDNGLTVGGEL